jgi:conjugative relaxase-like TrwC/TraI family protein
MVKFQVRHDVQAAVAYFLADSLLSDDEKQGVWLGSACAPARIQPQSIILPSDFESVLNGRSPRGELLCSSIKANRRAAWDCVVTPDKSISIAALCLATDLSKKVIEAFRSALTRLLRHMESLSYHQASVSGAPPQPASNLLAAQFIHQASRHADPHLHAHLLLINAVHCKDLRWRSLEPSSLYRNQTGLKLVFNAHLYEELVSRGFAAIRNTIDGITKLPVPKALCSLYSKAHNSIVGMASSILDSGVIQEEWARLPKASLINRLNERSRPKQRPKKPNWQTLLSEEQKAKVASLIVHPAAEPSSPPASPRQKPPPPPRTIIRERWLALEASQRTIRKVVAAAAAQHPEVPIGDIARAALAFRDAPKQPGRSVPSSRAKKNILRARKTSAIKTRSNSRKRNQL